MVLHRCTDNLVSKKFVCEVAVGWAISPSAQKVCCHWCNIMQHYATLMQLYAYTQTFNIVSILTLQTDSTTTGAYAE